MDVHSSYRLEPSASRVIVGGRTLRLSLLLLGAALARAHEGGEAPTPKLLASKTTRVSVTSTGVEANDDSVHPTVSANGRVVAFASMATNLVEADTNGTFDVFVHDRKSGVTSRVSVDSAGVQGANLSYFPDVSANGRFVAYTSFASNLVVGDTNAVSDVFTHDRKKGTTARVSVDSGGIQGNEASSGTAISANGRVVAFSSLATNLVPGDSEGFLDVFVHDTKSGLTSRISVSSSGTGGNAHSGTVSNASLSANGRIVAFDSEASNLIDGDTNDTYDVFVHDRHTGETSRVSVSSAGEEGNSYSTSPSISANGRFVAFASDASNLVAGDNNGKRDVFVHDRKTGATTRMSVNSAGIEGNALSFVPVLSASGRHVAFLSEAANLVADDTNALMDGFVHDRKSGETVRCSLNGAGIQADAEIIELAFSGKGRFAVFRTAASNLVPADTNGIEDIFVRDLK